MQIHTYKSLIQVSNLAWLLQFLCAIFKYINIWIQIGTSWAANSEHMASLATEIQLNSTQI